MTGWWALSKFFVLVVVLMSDVVPNLICLLFQVSVNRVQLNAVMKFSGCDPLIPPGGGDEPDSFILYSLQFTFLVVREGVQGNWRVCYY